MIVCCLPGTLWYIPKWRESDDVCDGKLIHIVKWRQNPPHLSLCMLAWARFSRENPSRASQQKTHFSISRDYQTSALCMLWSREKDAKSCMMSKFDFKEEKKLDCVTFAFCLFARLLRSVCAKVSKCQRDFSPRRKYIFTNILNVIYFKFSVFRLSEKRIFGIPDFSSTVFEAWRR